MKFPILAIVLIVIAGIFMFMFTMANYIFNDPDEGIIEQLNESAQETMSGDQLTQWDNQIRKGKEAFGIISVILFLGVIVLFFAALFEKRRREQ